jgi:hypothetical protein
MQIERRILWGKTDKQFTKLFRKQNLMRRKTTLGSSRP